MIRKPPEQKLTSKYFPFFHWRECNGCGKQFTLQWGWKFIMPSMFFTRIVDITVYLCDTCAPRQVVAEEMARDIIKDAKKNKFLPPMLSVKPPPPPPPPLKR